MSDVTLKITAQDGTFIEFIGVESPQSISWGGKQMQSVHQLIGGDRIVDTLGPNDDPLKWTGMFFGREASQRAKYLDTLRREGKPVTLTWDDYIYVAIITDFQPRYMQQWNVEYSILLTIIQDKTQSVNQAPQETLVQLLSNDNATAGCLGAIINDSALTGLLANISTALQNYSDAVEQLTAPIAIAGQCVAQVVQDTQSLLTALVAPLAAAQSRVTTLLTNVDTEATVLQNTANAVTSGALPSTVSAITSANVGLGVGQPLYALQGVLGRMQANVNQGSLSSSNRTIQVTGGNLQNIAAQYYGDATLWPAIAKANGLTDPVLPSSSLTLIIPSKAAL